MSSSDTASATSRFYIQPSGALPFTLIFPEEYCKHIAERDKVFFGDEHNNIPHPGSLSLPQNQKLKNH